MLQSHAQVMFDLEKHGEQGLERALRSLPVGGTLRLLHSRLGVTRVNTGSQFHPVVPPRIDFQVGWNVREDFKSVSTAAPALAKAHQKALECLQ